MPEAFSHASSRGPPPHHHARSGQLDKLGLSLVEHDDELDDPAEADREIECQHDRVGQSGLVKIAPDNGAERGGVPAPLCLDNLHGYPIIDDLTLRPGSDGIAA